MRTANDMKFQRLVTAAGACLFLAAWTLALPACNTMEGAGRDIKQAGQSIENKAEEKKNEPDDPD